VRSSNAPVGQPGVWARLFASAFAESRDAMVKSRPARAQLVAKALGESLIFK
jgi:hypothetical protein